MNQLKQIPNMAKGINVFVKPLESVYTYINI